MASTNHTSLQLSNGIAVAKVGWPVSAEILATQLHEGFQDLAGSRYLSWLEDGRVAASGCASGVAKAHELFVIKRVIAKRGPKGPGNTTEDLLLRDMLGTGLLKGCQSAVCAIVGIKCKRRMPSAAHSVREGWRAQAPRCSWLTASATTMEQATHAQVLCRSHSHSPSDAQLSPDLHVTCQPV